MAKSLTDILRDDMACEGLLECFYGLGDLDRRVFAELVESDEPLSVDAVAERVDRERSTAYRAVRRLCDAGIIEEERRTYEEGSYYHVYQPADPDEVADELQRLLNDWYAMMGQLIQEFRTKYAEETATPAD